MRWLLGALLLLAAGCAAGPELPDIPDRGELPFATAVNRAYDDVLAAPDDAEANGVLGMVLHGLDNNTQAEKLYRRAYLLAPDSFRWIYLLAETQASLGNYDSAVVLMRHALSKNGTYLPAKLRLAGITCRMGNYVEALQLLEELSAADETSALASYGLGRIAIKQARLDDAVTALRNACEKFPEFGFAHRELAFVSMQLQDAAKARQHHIQSETHKYGMPQVPDPLLSEVRGELTTAVAQLRAAFALESAGRYEAAVKGYEKALAIDPELAEAHARLIFLRFESKGKDAALAHYEEAIRLDVNLADAYSRWGQVLLREERFQEARDALDRALAANPFHAEALASLGRLRAQEQEPAEAEKFLRLALGVQPGYREAHLWLGSLMVDIRQFGEAAHEFNVVLETDDQRKPRFLYEISKEYLRSGNREQAGKCLREARELARKHNHNDLLDLIAQERWAFQ